MSTRQTTGPIAVPTVSVATTKVDAGSYFHAVHVNRTDAPTAAVPIYGDRPAAERLAAELRGALADAYSAGRADAERAAVRPLAGVAAGVTEPWNGHAYRVEIVAVVEANTPDEAQEVTGCLLAGRPTPQGHPAHALTGPGSWALETKRIEPVIPADWPVQPIDDDDPATNRATCGTCGLSWDDAISTSMTPAPSARCPFEPFHVTP